MGGIFALYGVGNKAGSLIGDTMNVTTDEDLATMHERQQEVLRPFTPEERWALIGRAHLLQNLGGGIFSGSLRQAARDLQRFGSIEAMKQQSKRDNRAAMRACGCSACARDAAKL